MSRNARHYRQIHRGWWGGIGMLIALASPDRAAEWDPTLLFDQSQPRSRVVIVHQAQATEMFRPQQARIVAMVNRAITNLTGHATSAAAWLSLVRTQDVIGIKVYTAPTAYAGTRPEVVAAVVESLLAARIPTNHIVVWDKYRTDLREAGFLELAARYGIRVEGCTEVGYDESTFYEPDTMWLGSLIWSDLEYGRNIEGAGRKSFVATLVAKKITKIINLTPLLNHNSASVCGSLYSLAMGSVDNTQRFKISAERLAQAVPEIYALPQLSDRVVLNIVDALICQYEGQQVSYLQYSSVLNELRFSTDPVALDVLSLRELERQRQAAKIPAVNLNWKLYHNASLLQLGVSDLTRIVVERLE